MLRALAMFRAPERLREADLEGLLTEDLEDIAKAQLFLADKSFQIPALRPSDSLECIR